MERNNIVEKKAVRRPRRVLEYWRGLILNLKTNMNFGTARNYRNSLYRFSEFLTGTTSHFPKLMPIWCLIMNCGCGNVG